MKATEVRVLAALEPGESYLEPTFLLVETVFDADAETVTTIEHVTSKVVDGKDRWTITTLGQSVPMTHSAAREWAISYAASRNIPLVYERDGTLAANYAATLSGASPASVSTSK